jgi:hypothetical protein
MENVNNMESQLIGFILGMGMFIVLVVGMFLSSPVEGSDPESND